MISTSLLMTKPVMPAAMPEDQLRSEITTGMSAPPIGMTSSTPRSKRDRQHTVEGNEQGNFGRNLPRRQEPAMTRKTTPLAAFWPGNVIGRPGHQLLQLRERDQAAGQRHGTDDEAELHHHAGGRRDADPGSIGRGELGRADDLEAPPPNPLSRATICGMAVILTA